MQQAVRLIAHANIVQAAHSRPSAGVADEQQVTSPATSWTRRPGYANNAQVAARFPAIKAII
jgi:hypothetical protein